MQQPPPVLLAGTATPQYIFPCIPLHLLTIIGRSTIMQKKSFTLIELLVVIAIITIRASSIL